VREVRLAQKGDMIRQREIWKRCFGDSDYYIDFYYAHRYKEAETMLLLEDGEIFSMLTMMPVWIRAADRQSFPAAMLYAVATHPQYQHRGFSTQLINFTHQYLKMRGNAFTVLVPSERGLFDFYRSQGYQDGFYIREAVFTREQIEALRACDFRSCRAAQLNPAAYNQRRNEHLNGKMHVAYSNEDVVYQAQLSQASGAGLFSIEIDRMQGCAAVERGHADEVFIKELLMQDELLPVALQQIVHLFPASKYVLRTPAFAGQQLEGIQHPFGMIRSISETDLGLEATDPGYLGLAFD
jgi:Predicted acetyltransferase involved in intracellular survival and related acetyltransferases